ncbi:MAG: hypothetical protein AAGC60_02600 [Acidobacteriota bacterium]
MSQLDFAHARELDLRQVAVHVFEGDDQPLELKETAVALTAANAAVPTAFQSFQKYFCDLLMDVVAKDLKNRQARFTASESSSVAAQLDALYRHPDRFQETSIALARGFQTAIQSPRLVGSAADSANRPAYFLFAEVEARGAVYYAILRLAQYFENQRELGAVAASMVQRYSESLANLVKGTAAYGVTLLGFLFTQVLAEQSADALLDRQQMVRIFLIYSGIVLAALVVYSLSEEGLLRRELAQTCKRLKQYHTRQDLESYLEKPLQVRRRQFYLFLICLMDLSGTAVAWVGLTFTELASSSA